MLTVATAPADVTVAAAPETPDLPTPFARVQAALARRAADPTAPVSPQVAADVEVLVERLRRLKARGGAFANLALGPDLAALHVQARLAS